MFGRSVTTANGAEVLSACGFFDAQSDSSDIIKDHIPLQPAFPGAPALLAFPPGACLMLA